MSKTRECGHPLGRERWCPDCVLAEAYANGEFSSRTSTAPAAPTEPTVEAVERELGMGAGAWDMVGPENVIRAVLKVYFSIQQAAPKAEQDDAPPGWKKTAYGWAQSGESILAEEQANGAPGADAEDAARYRWLREQDDRSSCFVVYGRNGQWGECGHCEIYGDLLDEAIDAARAAQGEAS